MSYMINRVYTPSSFYIPNGLHPGKQFIMRGRVTWGTEAFAINLQQDTDPQGGDIAFHFNPRPSQGEVIRNSCTGGDWQDEEKDQPHFPFEDGRSFILRIEVTASEFRTYVNGKPYINYSHRVDLGNVHFLHLTDGAEYYDITFVDRYGLPYRTEIPGGMQVGKAVRIRGAGMDNEPFSINFGCDCENETCAFHFNPRPNEGVVIRNANLGGWGDEERDYEADFPFSPGQYFDALFVCTDDKYHVYVNGEHFTDFNHRCGVPDVSHFHVQGNMDIKDVEYFEPLEDDFVKQVPSGMEKGDVVVFRGFMRPGGDVFSVNFMNGYTADSDIALHFNPRIGEGQVIMNCCTGGDWGEEEKADIPSVIAEGKPFEIKIVTKRNKFKVYVNENHFADFNHRLDFADATHLHILGDVDIAELEFLEPVDDDFVKEIPSGLEKGDVLLFRGFMRPESERFAINLHYGLTTDSDVALHFNPRIEQGQVVFNSRTDDSWADEERIDIPQCIAERKPFEIKIVTKSSKFKVYVNGTKVKKFESRGDIENIKGINVNAGAYIFQVKLERKLEKPVLERIPGGIRPGSWIIIHGMPKKNCDRFHINLKCGDDPESNVAFHFNPRFGEEHCTVRNTYVEGNWQEEEREEDSFPFEKKDTFEVAIKVMEEKFMTYVNGDHYIDFNHRLPLDSICHLEMDGLVEFYETEFL
ncbi:uncharacterized protein LOC127698939 isoform X1 [Mytilus californianus]|uniref:uncharacterized protein LOC127698939 isoform X1 n=1 Tax=Mytilus californianus TaxID=6549 RepID=UPI0022477E31|nr:uncharacterized protein LOC127698939 isoform X1 [Mytilus californianus]XP_052058662.1 uncharacterized protein LOC127698939 isoform X1 [Mytilus californianus]XP_052058663.1 uncharacterized protein LOC127698939 isoform X1 [Mytilus californianus]XP_052058664.1 uncharacterized protein LOC127698939 isoform X1 [Mytilus californianus]